MSKTLVVYYSHSGNTKKVGELIGEVLGADTLEVEPVERYTGGMWDVVDQWREEYNNDILRDIKDYEVNLDNYDTVILGSPNWGSTIATPLKTFIEENSFEGKKVVPFLTHGGGGAGHMAEDIYEFTGATNKVKALSVAGRRTDKAAIENWAKEIGL